MLRIKLSTFVIIGCIACFVNSIAIPLGIGTGAAAGTSIGFSKLAGLGTGIGVSKIINAGLVGGAASAGTIAGIGSLVGGTAGASAGSLAIGFGLPSVAISAGSAGTAAGIGIGIPTLTGLGLGGLGLGGLGLGGLGLGGLGGLGLGGLGLGGLGLGLGALGALPLLVVGKLALASGIGLAIAAGVLLKKKKEEEEYSYEEEEYYPPPTYNTYDSYADHAPAYSAPAPAYSAPAPAYSAPTYAAAAPAYSRNSVYNANAYNGYASRAYSRGRRAISNNKQQKGVSVVNALTPQALFVMESLIVDAANKDKLRCGARLICEMHQKTRQDLKTEETVLVDFFKFYLTEQPNADLIESPRDVFVYAASLGRFYPSMKQLCRTAFPECPLQDKLLFDVFHNATYSV